MADTEYHVLTKYDADTSGARHELGSLAVVFDHILSLAEKFKGMIEHIVALSSEAESAQIAMAGLMNASKFPGAEDFQQSMKMSSELMKIMRVDAAALSGTYEQMQSIFQAIIPVAHESGKSLMAAEHMSGRVMEFGNTFKIPAEFIGREFRGMMEGRASNRNALFKDLSSFMGGMQGQEFNALGAAEKWAKVESALSHFDPMFKEVGKTWTAQRSTLESYMNQLIRIGSGTLFEGLKGELAKINEWYTKNQTQVDEFVRKVGTEFADKLKAAFSVVKEAVAFIIAHRDTITSIAEAFIVFKGMSMMGGGFTAGGGVAGAPSLGGVAGGGGFGYVLAQLAGSTTFVNTAMMTLEGSLATLPGLLGMVAKGLLLFHGAMQFGIDKFTKWTDKEWAKEDEVGALVANMTSGKYHGADVGAVFHAAKEMGAIGSNFEFDAGRFRSGLVAKGATPALALSMAQTAAMEIAKMSQYDRADRMGFGSPGPRPMTEAERIKENLEKAFKIVEKHATNIGSINLYNNIYDAEDPARVIQRLTAKAVRDNITHPNQSASATAHQ